MRNLIKQIQTEVHTVQYTSETKARQLAPMVESKVTIFMWVDNESGWMAHLSVRLVGGMINTIYGFYFNGNFKFLHWIML